MGYKCLNSSSEGNITNSPLNIEYCVPAQSSLPITSDRRARTFVQFDSFDGTTYFNDNNTVGGIITDVREPRSAIEGDVHLSTIPHAFVISSSYQMMCTGLSKLCLRILMNRGVV